MDNKRLVKIGLYIIGFFFALAIVEIVIKFSAGKVEDISERIEEKKQEEKEYNSSESKTERQITTFLEKVFDAIKDEDYEYVMQMLDESYREYAFNNKVDELRTFAEKNYNFNIDYEIAKISRSGGLYQALVVYESEDDYYTNYFTVDVINENACDLIFGDYKAFTTMNEICKYSNIDYRISYCYETQTRLIYVLDIQNTSEENIEIDFIQEPQLITPDSNYYNGNKPDKVDIAPGETERVEVYFSSNTISPRELYLKLTENGVQKEVSIELNGLIF